jgi:prolyl-tRNA synthetase
MDADLIGLPLRLTLSERSLKKGGAEIKRRTGTESVMAPLDQAVEKVRLEMRELEAEIAAGVVKVPFKD